MLEIKSKNVPTWNELQKKQENLRQDITKAIYPNKGGRINYHA